MRAAIMQPYFFPYIGYFQLIHAVDKFVIYDDVSYIKQGWINRNRILERGKPAYFTLYTQGASSNKLINEVSVGHNAEKLIKTLKHNYKKAPFFQATMPLIESLLRNEEKNLALFLTHSLKGICEYLMIDTAILLSSQIKKDASLKKEQRLIDICKIIGCNVYINAIGGQALYRSDEFEKAGIKLNFLKPEQISYRQFDNDFVPWLSILDVMMFNQKSDIYRMLDRYELVN
ncbi:MAG: WbqC family protein [Peptococcaceae bacterium]|nr:WbqC family protein [Peptococcaceae bacterium]